MLYWRASSFYYYSLVYSNTLCTQRVSCLKRFTASYLVFGFFAVQIDRKVWYEGVFVTLTKVSRGMTNTQDEYICNNHHHLNKMKSRQPQQTRTMRDLNPHKGDFRLVGSHPHLSLNYHRWGSDFASWVARGCLTLLDTSTTHVSICVPLCILSQLLLLLQTLLIY